MAWLYPLFCQSPLDATPSAKPLLWAMYWDAACIGDLLLPFQVTISQSRVALGQV